MLFCAQVRSAGGPLAALGRGSAMGAEVIQIFTQSPRMWKPSQHDRSSLAEYRSRQDDDPVVQATLCHATYLINLASDDPTLYERSCACLVANLEVAAAVASDGLVLHVGSHRGAGVEARLSRVAVGIRRGLDMVGGACPILLENTAGSGGTIGRSFDELAAVIAALEGDPRLGICLDTQHLWASGVTYATPRDAEAVVEDLGRTVGLERLAAIHLNDSKVPLGANRDRHENLGAGTIGREALGTLLSHPALQDLPAILEVPGQDGRGPGGGDLENARAIRAEGLARRDRRRPRPIRAPAGQAWPLQ